MAACTKKPWDFMHEHGKETSPAPTRDMQRQQAKSSYLAVHGAVVVVEVIELLATQLLHHDEASSRIQMSRGASQTGAESSRLSIQVRRLKSALLRRPNREPTR